VGGVMDPRTSRRSPPGGFPIHIVDHDNPITRGMRDYIWTYNDDMYSNMSFDPQAKIHVLATTHDSSASYAPALAGPKYPASAYTPAKLKAMTGMDADQPAIWTVDYGKGRVFAFTMGHDEISLGLAGIDALLLRGTEWAATGDVTMPLPSDAQAFPLN
jgi:type 1 glutamine amidotransferase